MLPRWTIWILWMGVGILVFGELLFPRTGPGPLSEHASAKNDTVQIVAAIKNFYVEYERFPRVTENDFWETAEANAQLIRILCALDTRENPREIRFLEVPGAHKTRGVFRSGIAPTDGAWNDPWGHFYRIRITTDSNALKSPYLDEKTLPEGSILVWSLGKDGVQGTSVKSDDVTSWR